MRTFIWVLLATLLVSSLAVAQEGESNLIREDLLKMLLLGGIDKSYLLTNKGEIVKVLKADFGTTDEDLAFIMSIRAARIPVDGFDFFDHPTELVQLIFLYREARDEWGKPVTDEFYDFFRSYASGRVRSFGSRGTSESGIEHHFQLEHAKRRFKLP